jgi:hypothetical protein
LGVVLALVELVENAIVVLGVLEVSTLLELLGLCLDLLGNLSKVGASQLGDDVVKSFNGASTVVQRSTSDSVGAGLLVDELDEVLLGAAALVDLALLVSGGEELDGGISSDSMCLGSLLSTRGVGIDLGNNNVLVTNEIGRKGLPGRGEVLAVCNWIF